MEGSNLSFIPKKNLTSQTSKEKGTGFILSLSVIILIISLLFYGGVYMYQGTLTADIAAKGETLTKIQSQLEPATVREINKLSARIESLKIILANHRSLLDFFQFIGDYTLKTVRFSSFAYSDADGTPTVTLHGKATSFGSISLQAEKFYENINIKQVMLSGFSLGDRGMVEFNAKIIADPQLFSYKPNKASE